MFMKWKKYFKNKYHKIHYRYKTLDNKCEYFSLFYLCVCIIFLLIYVWLLFCNAVFSVSF